MKSYNELWSIAPERIEEWLRAQGDVKALPGGYLCGGCEIRLSPAPGPRLGKYTLPATRVELNGEDSDTDRFHRRFMMQFISAGG